MSQGAEEYLPEVSLFFRPEDLTHQELGALVLAKEAHDDPKHAIHHALFASQLWMSRNLTEEIINGTLRYDQSGIAVAADTLWQLYLPIFQRATVPALASAYLRGFAQAQAGAVPDEVIYALANEHAKRMGDYFHETSREAILEGFTSMVNRKVPARAAAERALAGYGLTPRQMSGLVALEPEKAVSTSMWRELKAKAKAYIGSSIRQRLKTFSHQEEHNLDEQAKQTAWLWLVEKGKMDPRTEKVWFTAKDERVCPICGPLHGKSVPVTEQFETKDGQKFWVPGVHVNCRCWVKTRVPRRVLESVSKADDWVPREHPRGGNPYNRGQFSRAPRKIVGVKERTTTNEGFDRIMRDLAARTEPISESVTHVEPEVETPVAAPVALTPPPVSLNPPKAANLAQPVSLAQPVALDPQTDMLSEAVTLTPTSQAVSLGEGTPHLAELLDPTYLPRYDAPDKSVVRPQKPKKFRKVKRTVELRDEHNQPMPIYAVLGPSDMLDQESVTTYSHNQDFHTNLMAAVKAAEDLRDEELDGVFNDLTQHGQVPVTVQTYNHIQGQPVEIKIDPSEVSTILETLAGQAAGEYMGNDDYIMLDHYDIEGQRLGTYRTNITELAQDMGISADDFRVAVIEIHEVHDSNRGRLGHESGTLYGDENYTVSGSYEQVSERNESFSHSRMVPVITMAPYDPETELIEVPDDDWNE